MNLISTWRNMVSAALLFAALLIGGVQQSTALSVSASAAVLMDAESGRVLYEHNAHTPMLIASTTKIMTALTALRHYDLNEVVTVSREVTLTEGSSMYLKEGEQLTVEELLYGLLLASGNDASEALARHCGDRERFVGWMNELAEEIGMTESCFENPSGLDGVNHKASAYDMAKLAACAMEDPTFARMVSTRSMTIGGRTLSNHNKLLWQLEGCVGLKTGYTKAAGRTLVSAVERDGRMLIAVTLCDGNDWEDHKALHEYGFSLLDAEEDPLLLPAGEAAMAGEKTGAARLFEKLRAWL